MMSETPYLGGHPWPTSSPLFRKRHAGQNMIGRQWTAIPTSAFAGLVGDILSVIPAHMDTVLLQVTVKKGADGPLVDVSVLRMCNESPLVHAFPGLACVHGYLDAINSVAVKAGIHNEQREPIVMFCHRNGDFWESTPRGLLFDEY